jgi:glycosyltransferase involved in cell wall biosynthesis
VSVAKGDVPAPLPLAVVVIACNEQAVIERCLASVQPGRWAGEVVLVDSGSTDQTRDIARSHGAHVVDADWQGPATQRNRGIAATRAAWVLCLDADEWLDEALRQEIAAVIATADAAPDRAPAVYRLPRSSSYCGRFMGHGGWTPDHIGRLFRRDAARYEGGIVHDRMVSVPEGAAPGHLRTPLLHEPYPDLERVLKKVNSYSTWGAETMVADGERPGMRHALLHGLWAFLRTYVVRAGFRDGREGLMLAISNAEVTYYKYVKAMLLARRADARGRTEPGAPRDGS